MNSDAARAVAEPWPELLYAYRKAWEACMTVLDDVREFLKGRAPRAVCDDCIADELKLSVRQHANHKTRELANAFGFNRRVDVCTMCKKEKTVISYTKRT